MERLNKFRGLLEFKVGGEEIILTDFTVNDLFSMIKLSKDKETELLEGVIFFVNILHRSYSEESFRDIEAFILSNYNDFINSLVVEIGWTTKKKLEESEEAKENSKPSLALFKARMAAEAEAETVEDRYITAGYSIMGKFKYSLKQLLEIPATTFKILLEEIEKQSKREKAEMDKARKK